MYSNVYCLFFRLFQFHQSENIGTNIGQEVINDEGFNLVIIVNMNNSLNKKA